VAAVNSVIEIGFIGVDVETAVLVGELRDVAVPLVAVLEGVKKVNVVQGGVERVVRLGRTVSSPDAIRKDVEALIG
jgi:hypothetical protein